MQVEPSGSSAIPCPEAGPGWSRRSRPAWCRPRRAGRRPLPSARPSPSPPLCCRAGPSIRRHPAPGPPGRSASAHRPSPARSRPAPSAGTAACACRPAVVPRRERSPGQRPLQGLDRRRRGHATRWVTAPGRAGRWQATGSGRGPGPGRRDAGQRGGRERGERGRRTARQRGRRRRDVRRGRRSGGQVAGGQRTARTGRRGGGCRRRSGSGGGRALDAFRGRSAGSGSSSTLIPKSRASPPSPLS